ncbi:hypothetical protein KBX53_10675 [Micromonospora sp. M51]|uniref:hypothetical protein n=1 Tax=Micromonospora sp. M51 TaxID=2824889 RepID=UPI001B37FCEE|nr:hypothetical protein [Micromonospora sp. M51]MBQ1011403.1 hypothetical protein [Micromonospora sp. M51]
MARRELFVLRAGVRRQAPGEARGPPPRGVGPLRGPSDAPAPRAPAVAAVVALPDLTPRFVGWAEAR